MKIKSDFVTNSSSASFMLYLTTPDTDINNFKTRLKNVMDEISYHIPTEEMNIKKIGNNVFMVHTFTCMYNNVEDIPEWVRTLFITWKVSKPSILKHGILSLYLEIEEDS